MINCLPSKKPDSFEFIQVNQMSYPDDQKLPCESSSIDDLKSHLISLSNQLNTQEELWALMQAEIQELARTQQAQLRIQTHLNLIAIFLLISILMFSVFFLQRQAI
jgi:hypothetical protein